MKMKTYEDYLHIVNGVDKKFPPDFKDWAAYFITTPAKVRSREVISNKYRYAKNFSSIGEPIISLVKKLVEKPNHFVSAKGIFEDDHYCVRDLDTDLYMEATCDPVTNDCINVEVRVNFKLTAGEYLLLKLVLTDWLPIQEELYKRELKRLRAEVENENRVKWAKLYAED